jgi:hypothetical protein
MQNDFFSNLFLDAGLFSHGTYCLRSCRRAVTAGIRRRLDSAASTGHEDDGGFRNSQ